MHGLKNAILAIFQKSADWLDWTCPVSAALQNGSHDSFFTFTFTFIFKFIFLNMKQLSEVELGLLVIQIQIQAVCYVNERPELFSTPTSGLTSAACVSQKR